ncbi:LacI family DNA-binding transcriptional regulator [Cellulomonas sp. NTE-D12]|uniref:LacI family DNA-binding transcriptional regulator n=1 Tax=Cellulomonas sp. NTE-D12 TaxID=2962632 RepID=UPI003081EADC|nr:alanine racemase [Cellulomonas sp. NTE-D12]
MGRKRVTLADVASAAGVSGTTASLVLSGRGDELRISPTVQQRVREASATLGYRPNIVSIGLRNGSSRTLGFVSDTVATSQLAGDMIKGALETARAHGFMLFIGETEGDPELERQLLDAMLDRQVDGIVLASMFTRTRPLPSGLDQVPAILLNALPEQRTTSIPAVIPDELTAGRAAAQLLLDAGHRSIHLVGAGPDEHDVPPGTVAGVERLAGIRETLHAAGLELASGHLVSEWEPRVGWEATHRLLEEWGPGQAIITLNDRLAFGVYQAIQEAGLTVPADVSVVSFDDAPLAQWLRPGLTTFAIPHHDLGRRAVELLVEQIGADGATAGTSPEPVHRVSMPLRERGSVARRG